MSEHTSTPWAVASNDRAIIREVPDMADGYDHYMVGVLSSHSVIGHEEARANAAFIVKAVNNHDAMDKLLAEAADYLNSHPGMDGMDLGYKITEFRRLMQADLIARGNT